MLYYILYLLHQIILYFEDNVLRQWQLSPDIDVSKLAIYSSLQLNDSSLILGTISNGIIHVKSDGSLKYKIDFEKGLTNNTILSIFQDQKNNLWLGLDIGISHVNDHVRSLIALQSRRNHMAMCRV